MHWGLGLVFVCVCPGPQEGPSLLDLYCHIFEGGHQEVGGAEKSHQSAGKVGGSALGLSTDV